MARSFNGSTDLIDFGADLRFAPAAMTAAGWFNPSSLTPAYSALISKVGGVSGGYYQLFVKSNGKLAVYVSVSVGGDRNYDGTGANTLTTGNWYHLAFSFSNAAGGVGYFNGSSDATFAGGGDLVTGNDGHLELGNDTATGGRLFGGSAADFAIWNTALTAPEIASLAKGYSALFVRPASILGYWPLVGRTSPEIELTAGFAGTLTGTAAAPHPRIIMPRREGKRPWIPAETVSV